MWLACQQWAYVPRIPSSQPPKPSLWQMFQVATQSPSHQKTFQCKAGTTSTMSSWMLLPGVGCSLAELCPAVQPLPSVLHCPHEDFPIIPCPTEPSPLVLCFLLVVPWHYHALCVSAEPTLTAKKIRLVSVHLGKYIWELTVLE